MPPDIDTSVVLPPSWLQPETIPVDLPATKAPPKTEPFDLDAYRAKEAARPAAYHKAQLIDALHKTLLPYGFADNPLADLRLRVFSQAVDTIEGAR